MQFRGASYESVSHPCFCAEEHKIQDCRSCHDPVFVAVLRTLACILNRNSILHCVRLYRCSDA